MTSMWRCTACGDGPFEGFDLLDHAHAHGHELRYEDFALQSSTAVRQRPLQAGIEEGPSDPNQAALF